MIEVDHDAQDYTEFQMQSPELSAIPAKTNNGQRRLSDLPGIVPSIESVAARLHAPVTTNRIDMVKKNRYGYKLWLINIIYSI